MKKLIAIFLTLLMLSSSTGLALGTHYCGGKAVKTQLVIGHADIDCGMAKVSEKCEAGANGKVPMLQKKPCCQNHYASVDTDNSLAYKTVISTNYLNFLMVFAPTFLMFNSSSLEENNIFLTYPPPFLKRDVQVLFQSFLI